MKSFTFFTAVTLNLLACAGPQKTTAPVPVQQPKTGQTQTQPKQSADGQVIPVQLKLWNTQAGSFVDSCLLNAVQKEFNHTSQVFEINNAALAAQLITFDSQWDESAITAKLRTIGFERPTFARNENRGVYGYVASSADVNLVHFRGTSDYLGAITDAGFISKRGNGKDITGLITLSEDLGFRGLVHTGFYDGYLSVKNIIETHLSSQSNKPIVFVGHSMGGALATLAAARAATKQQKVQGVYTYGAPRIGNTEFTNYLKSTLGEKVYRFTRGLDIVPHMPPVAISAQPFFESSPYFANFQVAIQASISVLDYQHGYMARAINDSKALVSVLNDADTDLQYWNQVVSKRASDAAYQLTLNASHPLVAPHAAVGYACDLAKMIL